MKDSEYTGKDIKVMRGLEGVRQTPGMYIGDTDDGSGLHKMVFEVLDNSIDEALAGFCNKIKITIHKDGFITIEDNGRGIPVDIHPTEKRPTAEILLTELHSGGKFDKKTYSISGGLHGVGVSVVNALSEKLKLTIYRKNVYKQTFERGITTSKFKKGKETSKRGTEISFKPDSQKFSDITFSFKIIYERIKELCFLNAGLSISLFDDRSGKSESLKYNGGILDFIKDINNGKETIHQSPIILKYEQGGNIVEAALQWNTGYGENIRCYTNNIFNGDGGTHLHGFKSGLTRSINSYIISSNTKSPQITGDDCREGLVTVLSLKMPEPRFSSQTKDKLISSQAKSTIETGINDQLSEYFNGHPSIAKNIIVKIINAAKAREAAKRARELSRKKTDIDTMSLAGKLSSCQSKNPEECELFIVEGNSAAGSCKSGRDRRTQAILPLRGKVLNVEKATPNKIIENVEIQNIIASLNTGVGKDLDIGKLRYHKIILLSDRDVDGRHINCLLLTLFYRHMRPLIENGNVYLGQPPLYKIQRGKNENYIQNEKELFLTLTKEGLKGCEINSKTTKTISNYDELTSLVDSIVISDSNIYKIVDAIISATSITEKILKDKDAIVNELKKMNKYLKQKYDNKFNAKFYIKNGEAYCSIIIQVSEEQIIIDKEFFKSQEFKDASKASLNLKKLTPPYILITNKGESLKFKTIYDLFEKASELGRGNASLQRYKGLGEMNPEQLWDTTMNPVTRSLLQVKIVDCKKADSIFDLLMGGDVDPRRDFIEKNALIVKNLDI